MRFEPYINATEGGDATANPATLLARHIFDAGSRLAQVGIEVHSRGGGYQDSGRGFTVEHDDETEKIGERERRDDASDLAVSIVEICANGQAEYTKPVNWRVTGYAINEKGDLKSLFSERFKVQPKRGAPTKKETEADVITSSNALLRDIAADAHKNYMDLAKAMTGMIKPISELTGNVADKIRPSDAEVAHKTRALELELEAAVAQAEATNKRARSENVKEAFMDLIGKVPMEDLAEMGKAFAQAKLERERNAERERQHQRQSASSETPSREENVTDTESSIDDEELCERSRTLSEIIAGRRSAIAEALGEHWPDFERLASQTEDEAFVELAKGMKAKLDGMSALQKASMLTPFIKALGDEERANRLQLFFSDAGLM